MAKIILAPHESFEHFHSEDSTTTLLEGSAAYRMGTVEHPLQQAVPVLTPATNRIPSPIPVKGTACLIAVIRMRRVYHSQSGTQREKQTETTAKPVVF